MTIKQLFVLLQSHNESSLPLCHDFFLQNNNEQVDKLALSITRPFVWACANGMSFYTPCWSSSIIAPLLSFQQSDSGAEKPSTTHHRSKLLAQSA